MTNWEARHGPPFLYRLAALGIAGVKYRMNAGIGSQPALDSLPFSPTRQMFNTAAEMHNVIHLSIGQPDFAHAEHIVDAHV